ncbi:MAG: mechanosensitive ion channel domain-containing protein, partial [Polyangiales bacterium]
MNRLDQGRTVLALGLWLVVTMAATSASAQGASPLAPETEPAATETSAELAEIERKADELRARLEEWQASSAEYLRAGEEAQARVRVIDQDLQQLQQLKSISIDEDSSLTDLDARLLEAERDLTAARQEVAELDAESELRADRRKKLPELMSIAKQRLSELEESPPPASADPALANALTELEALKRKVQLAEIQAYQYELGSYDARGTLLAKRRDRATLRITYYQSLSVKLREAKQHLERREVERENEATRRLLEELTALPDGFKKTLQSLYERNEALASLWTSEGGLHDQIEDVSEKLSRADEKVAEIEAELSRLAARVEAVGLADSVGVLLRRHRAEAPDIGMYQRFIRMRQEQIGDVQLQQIKLREQRQALADIDALVEQALASIQEPIPREQRDALERLLRQLFETQRKYMDALIEDYETYFQKLVDFDARQQELVDRTKDLLDFIDERILWIPSGRAVQAELLSDGRDAIGWLFGPQYWMQLARALGEAAMRQWPVNLFVLFLAILFIPFARRVRPRIRSLGDEAASADCARFGPTGEALGLSLLLAIWLPTLVAYVGWRLSVAPVATQFVRSVAYALVMTSGFWGTLRISRQLVRPGGIAEAHCAWPGQAANSLWRNLRWLTIVAVPAVLVISVFEMRGEDLWRESVGRFAFLISMLAVTVFNFIALRSGGSLAQISKGMSQRHLWVWRAVQISALAVPLALGAAALWGYYWTALQVAIRLHFNVLIVFLLVIVIQLVARWSLITQRRAALEEEPLEERPKRAAPTMEVSRLMMGTGLLLAVLGSFAIWADLLPATKILERVELWTATQTVTVSEVDPSGVEQLSTESRLVAVTLADLFRALLIGLLTLACIRALPGLLEVTLFRRLGPGERYAYSTILKYAVVVGGLALAFDAIGVSWSSIQWLVAAVGLGLGFGLQEIFANFVSGLIILFERPIRVGDTVTVGGVSGTVTKIQI